MIKIFKEEEFEESFINQLKEDKNNWDYDIRELDYLLKEHNNEHYVYLDGRLKELFGYNFKYFLKGEINNESIYN